jgi:hypothetical protein
MTKIIFIDRKNNAKSISVDNGDTVMRAAVSRNAGYSVTPPFPPVMRRW